MFGSSPPPQNEKTAFNPQSPYGISKVAAFHTTNILDKHMDCLLQTDYCLIMSPED